jgi:hypothetical protein
MGPENELDELDDDELELELLITTYFYECLYSYIE